MTTTRCFFKDNFNLTNFGPRLFVRRITGSSWATAKNVVLWWREGDQDDHDGDGGGDGDHGDHGQDDDGDGDHAHHDQDAMMIM